MHYKILIAVAVWAAAISCVKDVVMDAMEEPTLVVECILTDEPEQTLYLTYTKGASRDKAIDLPEAEAVLTDLTDGKAVGRFKRAVDGSWRLAYAAVPKHQYRLDVTVPGHDPVWAEQTMPEAPRIYERWKYWEGFTSEGKGSVNGHVFSMGPRKDPVWFYGVDYTDLFSPGEHTAFLCTDYSEADPFNMAGEVYTDSLGAQAIGARWLTQCFYENLEGSPLHRQYLRFPAGGEKEVDTEFHISGSFRGYVSDYRDFAHAEVRPAELHFFSASDSYDRFLKESIQLLEMNTPANLVDIFFRENVYSNIQGGIGLFGARIEKSLVWDSLGRWEQSGVFMLTAFRDFGSYQDEEGNYGTPMLTDVSMGYQEYFSFIPCKLLCYEVKADAPTEPNSEKGLMESLVEIRDESQLALYGLEGYGPVDFSKKEVLLVTHDYPYSQTVANQARIPVLIACLQGLGPLAKSRRLVFLSVESSSEAPFHVSSYRIAIVIDRQEEMSLFLYDEPIGISTDEELALFREALVDLTGKST